MPSAGKGRSISISMSTERLWIPTKGSSLRILPPKDELDAMANVEMGNIRYLVNDQKQAKEAYKKAIEVSHDEKFKEKLKLLLKEVKAPKRGGT